VAKRLEPSPFSGADRLFEPFRGPLGGKETCHKVAHGTGLTVCKDELLQLPRSLRRDHALVEKAVQQECVKLVVRVEVLPRRGTGPSLQARRPEIRLELEPRSIGEFRNEVKRQPIATRGVVAQEEAMRGTRS
jgi:hypothetical protein